MAALPAQLQALLRDAVQVLEADPDHRLDTEWCYRISSTVGQLVDQAGKLDRLQARRIQLIILTLRALLPLWEQLHPDTILPQSVVQLFQQYLEGTCSWDVVTHAMRTFEEISEFLDDPTLAHPSTWIVISIVKGYEAINTVIGKGDGDRSAENHAGVSLAAAAQAMRWTPRYPDDLPAMRERQFWLWWLTQAVPSVYVSYPAV